jgi:hypothetical protein
VKPARFGSEGKARAWAASVRATVVEVAYVNGGVRVNVVKNKHPWTLRVDPPKPPKDAPEP